MWTPAQVTCEDVSPALGVPKQENKVGKYNKSDKQNFLSLTKLLLGFRTYSLWYVQVHWIQLQQTNGITSLCKLLKIGRPCILNMLV